MNESSKKAIKQQFSLTQTKVNQPGESIGFKTHQNSDKKTNLFRSENQLLSLRHNKSHKILTYTSSNQAVNNLPIIKPLEHQGYKHRKSELYFPAKLSKTHSKKFKKLLSKTIPKPMQTHYSSSNIQNPSAENSFDGGHQEKSGKKFLNFRSRVNSRLGHQESSLPYKRPLNRSNVGSRASGDLNQNFKSGTFYASNQRVGARKHHNTQSGVPSEFQSYSYGWYKSQKKKNHYRGRRHPTKKSKSEIRGFGQQGRSGSRNNRSKANIDYENGFTDKPNPNFSGLLQEGSSHFQSPPHRNQRGEGLVKHGASSASNIGSKSPSIRKNANQRRREGSLPNPNEISIGRKEVLDTLNPDSSNYQNFETSQHLDIAQTLEEVHRQKKSILSHEKHSQSMHQNLHFGENAKNTRSEFSHYKKRNSRPRRNRTQTNSKNHLYIHLNNKNHSTINPKGSSVPLSNIEESEPSSRHRDPADPRERKSRIIHSIENHFSNQSAQSWCEGHSPDIKSTKSDYTQYIKPLVNEIVIEAEKISKKVTDALKEYPNAPTDNFSVLFDDRGSMQTLISDCKKIYNKKKFMALGTWILRLLEMLGSHVALECGHFIFTRKVEKTVDLAVMNLGIERLKPRISVFDKLALIVSESRDRHATSIVQKSVFEKQMVQVTSHIEELKKKKNTRFLESKVAKLENVIEEKREYFKKEFLKMESAILRRDHEREALSTEHENAIKKLEEVLKKNKGLTERLQRIEGMLKKEVKRNTQLEMIGMMQKEDFDSLKFRIIDKNDIISKLRMDVSDLKHEMCYFLKERQALSVANRDEEFEDEQTSLRLIQKLRPSHLNSLNYRTEAATNAPTELNLTMISKNVLVFKPSFLALIAHG